MKIENVVTIVRKELFETLRDKRTLIAMIGIPLLLYPGLILVVGQAATLQMAKLERQSSRVALVGGGVTGDLRSWVDSIEKVEVVDPPEPRSALKAGEIDAVVSAPEGLGDAVSGGGSGELSVEYDSTEPESRAAVERVKEGLEEAGRRLLERRLEEKGLGSGFARPLKVTDVNIAPPQKRAGFFLGTLLPTMMILMIGVGAFYPAIDLTAGEKERGTFETLLSTPVSKTEIVCGKFVTVLCLALLTGALNLASMTATMGYQLAQAREAAGGGGGEGFVLSSVQVSVGDAALMALVLIPMAFFICAVMMSIALLARNFKEANNYVGPFFLFIALPGVLAGMPGVELTRTTACIPIANVALLFREMLTDKATLEAAFLVFTSTAAYSVMALVGAVWLFQREEVILSEDKGVPLTPRRSQFIPRAVPTAGMSMLLVAVSLLLLFYVGSPFQARDLLSGIFITQWGLFFAPTVLLLWYTRVNLRTGLNLRRYPLGLLPATALLWAGVMVLANLFSAWLDLPKPEVYDRAVGGLMQTDGTRWGATLLLLAVAVSPAVCEEVLFRGAVLSGLRTRLSGWASVLVVGLLFGLMHVNVYAVVPTTILGIAITYVAVRGGSIFPAMLFHLLNNTLAALLGTESLPPSWVAAMERWESDGVPGWLPWAGVALTILGVAAVELTTRSRAKGLMERH